MDTILMLLMLAWLVAWPIATISLLIRNSKLKRQITETGDTKTQETTSGTLSREQQIVERQKERARELEAEVVRLTEENNRLARYRAIADVDAAIAERKAALLSQRDAAMAKLKEWRDNAQNQLREQQAKATQEIEDRRSELQREEEAQMQHSANERAAIQVERTQIIAAAHEERERIVSAAQEEAAALAKRVAELTEREATLQAAIPAIKNAIHGYDDSYLIPTSSLLDELAEQYDFRDAGRQLKAARERTRVLIKSKSAASCEYVQPERRDDAVRFILDAFNGKVDSVLAKVKHDNYGILRQQIEDAFSIVNANGSAFRNARILPEYLVARLDELKWAVAVRELQKQDREEQKRIQQQIREEARAQREYERAMREAAKEEQRLADAIAKVQAEMLVVSAEQRKKYEAKLQEMEAKLKEAEEKNQKALSMAQQTKSGHVYVISNIGSFGEDIFKIGMTRRLEPLDRIQELSNASVPFPFDVHAMLYSDNAPTLEHTLHILFGDNQVNRVNPRKEFFRVNLATIRAAIEDMGLETQWTMRAEAAEYRESLAMLERGEKAAAPIEDDDDMDMEEEEANLQPA